MLHGIIVLLYLNWLGLALSQLYRTFCIITGAARNPGSPTRRDAEIRGRVSL